MNIYNIIAIDAAKKPVRVAQNNDNILLLQDTVKDFGMFPSIIASRLFINKQSKSRKIKSMFTYSNACNDSSDDE